MHPQTAQPAPHLHPPKAACPACCLLTMLPWQLTVKKTYRCLLRSMCAHRRNCIYPRTRYKSVLPLPHWCLCSMISTFAVHCSGDWCLPGTPLPPGAEVHFAIWHAA